MEKNLFIKTLLQAALDAGIEAAEVYASSRDSFRAMSHNGEVDNYSVASRSGLSLRGLYKGKMGYASTQVLDEEAIELLIDGAGGNARMIENEDEEFIFPGSEILMKIDRVGKDMQMAQGMCGSISGSVPTNVGQPMIRVTSLTVGGR